MNILRIIIGIEHHNNSRLSEWASVGFFTVGLECSKEWRLTLE